MLGVSESGRAVRVHGRWQGKGPEKGKTRRGVLGSVGRGPLAGRGRAGPGELPVLWSH